MQKRLLAPLKRAGAVFTSFSGPQRVIAMIGVAVLVLGSVFFYRWAAAPTMTPLFTNLASADASAIVTQLDTQKVNYQLTDGGATIMVPKDQVYKLRLSVSATGLPSSKDTGYALLDQEGVTASEFQQQVTYQRAMEGELANTVKSIDGVDAAVVHLAIPSKDVFTDSTSKPTASVLVTLTPGKTLDDEQVQSIVHLVSSSVQGMDAKDVTVVDGKGALLSSSGGGSTGTGMRNQQTTDYESRVSSQLQQVLDRVVGPGNAVATVNADLNYDDVNRTTESYSASKGTPPLTETKTSEKYAGNGSAATGVLGPDNIAVPSGTSTSKTSKGSGYAKTGDERTNAVNKTTTKTDQAAGSLTRQSVSVVVNSAAGNVDMTQLTQAVTAAAGIDSKRGDVISVTKLPFDTSSTAAAAAATKAADAAAKKAQLFQVARTGGIILAGLIVAIVALLMSRRRVSEEVLDLDAIETQAPQEAAWARDEATAGAPEALEATPATAALEVPRHTANSQREEVAQLVENQPDEVADLLRGWLADRRS